MTTLPRQWICAAMLLLGCATSAGPLPPIPAIQPADDLQLPPPPKPLQPGAKVVRFRDHATRTGECPGFPAGILVDHLVYAELQTAKIDREHLRTVVGALEKLRVKERLVALELEQAWTERADTLETTLTNERRSATWKVATVLVAGLAIGLTAGVAINKAAAPW